MKLMLAIFIGFVASIATSMIIGFCIGMAFPLGVGSPGFYAAMLAGIIISMTVFYFSARGFYRRDKREDSHYAERLA
jgi:membrane protein implicated in regulation of membrane protease activity